MAQIVFGASVTLTSDPQTDMPLLSVAQELEHRYGWRITYEEGPISNLADLENNVPSFANKAGPVSLPIAVRKHSALMFTFDDPGTPYDREAEIKIIDALLQDYQQSVNLPYFAVRHSGSDYSHIVQVFTKDEDGNVIPFQPLLDTPITFPKEMRQVDTTVKLILHEVAAERNVGISEGLLPTMLFRQVQVDIGANNESARSALIKALDAAQLQRSADTRVVWHLYYDVRSKYYYFNAQTIAGNFKRWPVTEAAPPATQTPIPHPANAWFRQKAAQ
jgi:hypothetical protein